MANTYASLHYHLIFSTKNRVAYIKPEIEQQIWPYLGGVARKHKMTALQIGGCDDHIHALVLAPPVIAPSQIARYLKGDSSKWIHETFLESQEFAWQEGYGAFTVSKSNLESVVAYIQNQRAHHQHGSFQDEYLEFLQKHGVEYDERYVWG
jgi:REP element-mobilizing transposase RayT